MAHAWWHPITTAIGNVATSIGQGMMSDAGRAVMGAGGLALVNKAYQDLEDIGERAFTGVDPIAAAGLQQTAFRPFTVSVGSRAFPGSRYASSSIGVGIPAPSSFETMGREERIQQLMAQNPNLTREQAIANQDFSRMQGIDINNDGVVTNQEYSAAMQSGLAGGGRGGAGGDINSCMGGGRRWSRRCCWCFYWRHGGWYWS